MIFTDYLSLWRARQESHAEGQILRDNAKMKRVNFELKIALNNNLPFGFGIIHHTLTEARE